MGPPSEKGGIHDTKDRTDLFEVASMGPPSEKGGISQASGKPSGALRLQWGRPPRRAESVTSRTLDRGRTASFNGAALREGRNR